MPRALQLGAGLGLALVILTCTNEQVTGPTRPGRLALDIHALLAGAPGQNGRQLHDCGGCIRILLR